MGAEEPQAAHAAYGSQRMGSRSNHPASAKINHQRTDPVGLASVFIRGFNQTHEAGCLVHVGECANVGREFSAAAAAATSAEGTSTERPVLLNPNS